MNKPADNSATTYTTHRNSSHYWWYRVVLWKRDQPVQRPYGRELSSAWRFFALVIRALRQTTLCTLILITVASWEGASLTSNTMMRSNRQAQKLPVRNYRKFDTEPLFRIFNLLLKSVGNIRIGFRCGDLKVHLQNILHVILKEIFF